MWVCANIISPSNLRSTSELTSLNIGTRYLSSFTKVDFNQFSLQHIFSELPVFLHQGALFE